MSHIPPELDRFVHALISPLTALRGATGLLRRQRSSVDQRTRELLDTLERSVERLRQTCETIISHAESRHGMIQITLDPTSFTLTSPMPIKDEGPQELPSEPQAFAPTDDQPVLLMVASSAALEELDAALGRRGRPMMHATSSIAGIDIARSSRPALIVIDQELDELAPLSIGVFADDPDTKTTPIYRLPAASATNLLERIGGAGADADTAARALEQQISLSPVGRRARPRIMIVDDENDIATLIGLQFQADGYDTVQVRSGTDALRLVREGRIDLIVLDLLLPDIDGFAVLGGLRAQPETQLTPIILLSALNAAGEKVRGLQLGADDYITKPFSTAELSARVQAAMRRSEREGGANPSTRLPGNIAIERTLSQRIAQGAPFVVCYSDLDNFKAYNDTYGFLKGDAVIQRTAQILLDCVRELGNLDDFVGHIGGDDFVLVSTPDRVEAICGAVIARFDATAPLFYDDAARRAGMIRGVDRQGRPATFPLVSISIVAVSSERLPFSHPGEVAQRSIEPKKRAKQIDGSVLLLDE